MRYAYFVASGISERKIIKLYGGLNMEHDRNKSEEQYNQKIRNISFVGIIIFILILFTILISSIQKEIENVQYQKEYNLIHQSVPSLYTKVDSQYIVDNYEKNESTQIKGYICISRYMMEGMDKGKIRVGNKSCIHIHNGDVNTYIKYLDADDMILLCGDMNINYLYDGHWFSEDEYFVDIKIDNVKIFLGQGMTLCNVDTTLADSEEKKFETDIDESLEMKENQEQEIEVVEEIDAETPNYYKMPPDETISRMWSNNGLRYGDTLEIQGKLHGTEDGNYYIGYAFTNLEIATINTEDILYVDNEEILASIQFEEEIYNSKSHTGIDKCRFCKVIGTLSEDHTLKNVSLYFNTLDYEYELNAGDLIDECYAATNDQIHINLDFSDIHKYDYTWVRIKGFITNANIVEYGKHQYLSTLESNTNDDIYI